MTPSVAGVRVEFSLGELIAADTAVVLTDHDAFDFDLVASRVRYVLDTRDRLLGPQIEQL